MIPKDSTPIKNKILIDILAKGLLSKDEMRIIFYIIRWSWGFNGVGRRQDWTKGLNITGIAKDIGMDRSYCNRIILKMFEENKIKIKNNSYQFNEHYEGWVKTTRKVGKNYPKGGWKLPTKRVKTTHIAKKNSLENPIKQESQKNEHLFKETLKETNKENKDKKKTLRSEIIKYLNQKTGAHYKVNTPETIKHINARLKEGFTLKNFRYVIDVKCAEWKGKFTKDGKNCEDWLRPITLFGTKFESYLNQAKPDPFQKYYKKGVN